MDRVFKTTITIIGLLLILAGLFIIYRLVSLNYPETQKKIPASFPISYAKPIESNQPVKVIKDDRLIIQKIDVDLAIGTDEKYLDFGGWIVKTGENDIPVAIAIHRFGLDSLTNEQKIHQTLFNVNKLQESDLITLDWQGKEYIYTIKDMSTDTNNPAINKDELLLYTCEYWNSPERVFVLLQKMNQVTTLL